MRFAVALFINALVTIAYFPEGGESMPVGEHGNKYSPSSGLLSSTDRREGEILKRKNEEADRLLTQIEVEKEKIRIDLENLSGKPNAGLHGLQSPHIDNGVKPTYPSGSSVYHKPAPGVGAHGIAHDYGAVQHVGHSPAYGRSSGSPCPTSGDGGIYLGPILTAGHAPFNASGLYAGVKYTIGYDSDSDSDSSENKKPKYGKKGKKLIIKVAKHYEDGTKVPKEARKAIEKYLENQVRAGNYQPIPATAL